MLHISTSVPQGLIFCVFVIHEVGVIVHRKSQNQMSKKMNDQLELMESNIRRDIRQGQSSLKLVFVMWFAQGDMTVCISQDVCHRFMLTEGQTSNDGG